MSKSFFDLLEIGLVQELGSHTFTAEEIIAFATKFDPQPFHICEKAAAESHFGGLCASGWHTASVWMRKNVDDDKSSLIKAIQYDGDAPVFGPSPGVRNIKWAFPVYVGDTITFRATLTGKRTNPKRPGWGLLTNHSEAINQDGKLVMSMDGAVTLRTD